MNSEWGAVVNWDLLCMDRLWEMIDDACILCYEHSHRRYLNCICIKSILDFLVACFIAPDYRPGTNDRFVRSRHQYPFVREQNDHIQSVL